MKNDFSIGIIGLGISGVFATYRLAEKHKNKTVIAFDLGRKWKKRKRLMDGWLGCFPTSDGKLYMQDLNKLTDVVGVRRVKTAHRWFNNIMEEINDFKVIKDKQISTLLEKKFTKNGYKIVPNNYIQIYPKDIHTLSSLISTKLEDNPNFTFKFDTEVVSIQKQKNGFLIKTEDEEFRCQKLIIGVGRSGWRWAAQLFTDLGIVEDNDIGKFGIRIETSAENLKDFNGSNATIIKPNCYEIGPLSWYGSIIPEDHIDMAISSFRSNEERWLKKDKVSYNLIGYRSFPNQGWQQIDRLAKLTFILTNDRIAKERITTLLNSKSKISIVPEYDWLKDTVKEIGEIAPELINKAYFHIPTILPYPPAINLGSNLETEVEGMFVIGETMGFGGILSSAISGIIVGDSVCK